MTAWPITFEDVLDTRQRLQPFLLQTPLRNYAPLDECVGNDIRVYVKHENHQPTNSFKVRNGLSVLTALNEEERRRGVVAATRGNHGLGLAYAGRALGTRVTVCVPVGNNPEKNAGIKGLGAELIESGRDYEESTAVAASLVQEKGMRLVHSTNEPLVIMGAGTMTLEILEQQKDIDAMVISIGGGSQAVGALTVARKLRPEMPIYGVQAERASAIHDSWHAHKMLTKDSADTFADGLATRRAYEGTFYALREGLADFITVSEAEIADALRLILRTTHNLCEGAGATGLAGLLKLRERLAGKRVAVILSGSNIDETTLRRVLMKEL